ncbi:hypothetical protein [Curtobacterium sp. 1544]|uniref:hypothetical protein n=1 Tax=Curtobacterium sp. 1544 TaxID=3156417 RepID=UPI003395A919
MASTYRGRYSIERTLLDRTALDSEESFDWDVALVPAGDGSAFLIGTLDVANERGVAQITSLARLTPTNRETASDEAALASSRKHHLRPLYDNARRALASQAALMDMDFAISQEPPNREIRLLGPVDDDEIAVAESL